MSTPTVPEESETEAPHHTNCIDAFFNYALLGMIVLIVITLFFAVFLSTMIFVYSVITTIVYRIVGLIYNFSVVAQQPAINDNVFSLVANVMWFFYAIPLVALFLSTVMKIVNSFFSNMWAHLNPSSLLAVVNSTQGNGKRTSKYWITFFSISLASIFSIFVIIILGINALPGDLKNQKWVQASTTTVCILFCFTSIFYIFKVFFTAWTCMFRTEPKDRISQEAPLLNIDSSQSDGAVAPQTNENLTSSFKDFYDPADLISEHEWIDYMKDPRFNCFLYSWRMRHERLYGIAVFFLVIVMQIFVVRYSIHPAATDTSAVVLAGFHLIFYIIALPFLIICNVTSIFFNFKKLSKYPNVRLLTIVSIAIFILLFIVGIIFSTVFAGHLFPLPQEVRPLPPPDDPYINYTVDTNTALFPPICSLNYRKIPLTTLVALLAASYNIPSPYKSDSNRTVFENTVSTFLHGTDPPITLLNSINYLRSVDDNLLLARYDLEIDNDTQYVVAIQGLSTPLSYSFFIDQFIHSYLPTALDMVIPFFSLADSFVLHETLLKLSYWLQKFFAFDSATEYYAQTLQDFSIDNIMTGAKVDNGLALVGHTIGGTFAKLLSITKSYQGYSFESLKVFGTYLESKFHLSDDDYLPNLDKVMNFYSSPVFGQIENKLRMNVQLPSATGKMNIGPYDTLCTFVAMCSNLKVQYDFCDDAIGYNQFDEILNFFEKKRLYIPPQNN